MYPTIYTGDQRVQLHRERVEIGRYTTIHASVEFKSWMPSEKIVIGNFCSIAKGVWICVGGNHTTDTVSTYPFDFYFLGRTKPHRSYVTTANTEIGHDVWIGCRASVLGGVKVGSGAVIANSAVVFNDVPPYAVVAGNPAKVLRYRFSRPVIERLQQIAWWDWTEARLRANVEWFYRPIGEFVEHFDPTGDATSHGRPHYPAAAGAPLAAVDPAPHAAAELWTD